LCHSNAEYAPFYCFINIYNYIEFYGYPLCIVQFVTQWPRIQIIIMALEKLFAKYAGMGIICLSYINSCLVSQAIIEGKEVARLADYDFGAPGARQLLKCVVNIDDVCY